MTKINARNAIIKMLKKHNWYAVIHSGHFGKYFRIMDLNKCTNNKMTSEIYSAIYEEYDDKYDFNNCITYFNLSYNSFRDNTWNHLMLLVKNYLKDHNYA